MSEASVQVTKKIIPSETIVDFSVLGESLSSEDKFRSKVEELTQEDELPIFFPGLPDFIKAKNRGLMTNQEYMDGLLSLPESLYDSDTYVGNLELRGPMEEIIYRYEIERKKQGLKMNAVRGDGWSENFRSRINRFRNPHISRLEELIDPDPEPELPKRPKGRKIA